MADAFKIGVSILLNNQLTPALTKIAGQLVGMQNAVNLLNTSFARLGMLAGGAVSVLAGREVLKGYAKLVEHGEKLVHYQTQLRAAGYSQLQVQEATNRAYKTGSEILTSRYADNLRDIHHLADITGDFNEAMQLSPVFAGVKQTLASLKDDKLRKHFEGDEMQTYNFARALESMGHTQEGPESIKKWAEGMESSMIAFRGLVDGTKFYQAVNLSGGAAMNWSMDFVTKKLPFLIQEMNAPAAGNALYMFQRGLAQGQVPKGSAEGLEKYGLIRGSEDYLTDSSKRYLGLKPGAVKGSDMIQSDPEAWVRQVLMPALKSHGVDTTNKDQIATAVGEIARNKNFLRMIKIFALQQAQMDKEITNVERVMTNGGAEYLNTDPSLMKKAFWSQLDNLLTVLGSQQVAPAYEMLNYLTLALRDMAHALTLMPPDQLRALGYGIGALGVALVGAGGVAILAALGPGGWLVLAIGGLVAAAVALKQLDPNHGIPLHRQANDLEGRKDSIDNFNDTYIQPKIQAILAAKHRFDDAVIAAAESVANVIGSIAEKIASALTAAASAIGRAASAIGGAIGGMIPNPFKGAEQPQKQNYLNSPRGGGGAPVMKTALVIGDREWGQLVSYGAASGAGGPLRGSVHLDGTDSHGHWPQDTAYA